MATPLTRLGRALSGDRGSATQPMPASLPVAAGVALGSMALLGLGGWLWWVQSGLGDRQAVFLKSVVLATAFNAALWLAWMLVAYAVIERTSNVRPRVEAMLASAALACAPLALGLLMAVPAVSFGAGLVAIVAWVLATQSALERATGAPTRTVAPGNLAGFALWALAMSLLSTATDQLAPGPFLAESIWDAISGYDAARGVIGPQ